MSNDFKRIPYGISNFKQVQEDNLYLVDKTMFFERMERAGNFLFLVRPRRFGKSLFLNMLEALLRHQRERQLSRVVQGFVRR